MIVLAFFTIFYTFSQSVSGTPDGDRLRFSDRREPEDPEYRTFDRLRPSSGGSSGVEDVLKIPIAVIKGTSAAAQAFSPQNTQAIQSIFDIPVTTLDAVGNYIKDSRPQIPANNNNNNDDGNIGAQRPLRLGEQRRQDRRERILRLREQERERRRVMDEGRFFYHGHHSNNNFFSTLADLLLGGGGHHGGNFFGNHGHGHHSRPPKRPSKPLKPSKPGHHGGHGSFGNRPGGSGHYEVHEQLDDGPVHSLGIFPWLQMATTSQSNVEKIQNKIAPGSRVNYD